MVAKRKRPDGADMWAPPQTPLALGRVRYVGDPIALVVADSVDQAKSAAEMIDISFNPLPSVTDTAQTIAPDSPAVWDECPDNISHIHETGDKSGTDEAFKKAAKIVKRRFVITRVHAQFMEPEGSTQNMMSVASAIRFMPMCNTPTVCVRFWREDFWHPGTEHPCHR